MTDYQLDLVIDLGEVGYRNDKAPFRVRLDTRPLNELIRDARQAYRVYELLLIDRPGDIWDYVRVIPESVPKRVASSIAHWWEHAQASSQSLPYSISNQLIPFNVFDRFFYWALDDTEPEDAAWLGQRDAPTMSSFANMALGMVRNAQQHLGWNDHLLRHIVNKARSGELTYCHLERETARRRSREHGPPSETGHSKGFYEKLARLLRDPELASVACMGRGDYQVLRMLATEQRRRAALTGHLVGHALHLGALVNKQIGNEAWDSEIHFFGEGLSHGDLFIKEPGLGNLRLLFEDAGRGPGRYVLSSRDEGDINGFERESGDGWFLYTRIVPDSRRLGMERLTRWGPADSEPILVFDGPGTTVFHHEKAVILVGADVPSEVRAVLAGVISDWHRLGGDPLVIVDGKAAELNLAAGGNVVEVPEDLATLADRESWLYEFLRERRPWIDVLISLDAPDWAVELVDRVLPGGDGPWAPWIVATRMPKGREIDFLLEGELLEIFSSAHRKAISRRPVAL